MYSFKVQHHNNRRKHEKVSGLYLANCETFDKVAGQLIMLVRKTKPCCVLWKSLIITMYNKGGKQCDNFN